MEESLKPHFDLLKTISSVESQKAVIAVQRCSVETRRALLPYTLYSEAAFWFSTEHLCSAITPFWLSTDDFILICYNNTLHRQTSHRPGPARVYTWDKSWTGLDFLDLSKILHPLYLEFRMLRDLYFTCISIPLNHRLFTINVQQMFKIIHQEWFMTKRKFHEQNSL